MVPTLLAILGTSISIPLALAQVQPPGTPFPNSYYPGYEDPLTDAGAQSFQTSPPEYPSPWMDGSGGWHDAYIYAQNLVRQMTLAEKVNLTTGVGWEGDRCVGNTGSVPRLGIRSLCLEDSPLGVRDTDFVTAFPAGVTIAASWDRAMCYQRGKGMGAEHFGKGVDAQLGPVVGPLGRVPEGGRGWEGFSPDPVLSGICVAQTVKGIQDSGVIATTKHYIGNEQEHFRSNGDFNVGTYYEGESSNIDDITLHELYLWPFADAIRAGTGSIMCSYNQINNSYSCQNSYTLNKLLKGELGFQGFVMSDWAAQHSGVSSALAGLDMTMPGDEGFDSGNSFWGANLTIAVLNGTVPEWRVDDMATRILAAWTYVGRNANNPPEPNFSAWTLATNGPRYFESGTGQQVINEHVNVQGNHAQQVLNQAIRGTVLLKNTNNALPLTGQEKFLAIIGDDAGDNIEGPNGCSDRGCTNNWNTMGNMAMGWGSGTANFPFLISPLSAIQQYAVNHGTGDVQWTLDNYNLNNIRGLASQASTALVFVSTDSGEGYITVDGNAGDRNNLTLWGNGEAMINAATSVCNNTIVVVHSVGPVLIGNWSTNPNVTGIVWANVPGEQSGNALTQILYGMSNPGGKLPYTLGKARSDYGTDIIYVPNEGANTVQINYAEGVYIDYRAFDKHNVTPVYEFGYGLSYTTFAFSNLQIQSQGHATYKPNTGVTQPAPSLGTPGTAASAVFPAGFIQLKNFIYSFINSTDLKAASGDPSYGQTNWLPANAQNGSAQPVNPAGGAPGGNPALWDVMFTVTATITNTGGVAGDEVPQLYIGLGGPNDPIRVLRNFDRIHIPAKGQATFKAQITRRDISNWDPAAQNWYISSAPKTVYVGNSSRNLPLQAALPMSNINGVVQGNVETATYASEAGAAATETA